MICLATFFNITREIINLKLFTIFDFDNLGQFGGELSELDDAGTYFDLGPRKVTQAGTYHYMCSRNNNFSNRSQKGKLVVSESRVRHKSFGPRGGVLKFSEDG